MQSRYKLAIFDLDGTVLDTLADLAASTNIALRQNGLPVRSVSEICSFVGNGMKKLIDRAVPGSIDHALAAKVLADFKAHYAAHCTDKTAPYTGVPAMLAALRAAGVKLAVLSNKADAAVQVLCRQYFPDMFDVVAGERENEGIRKKPAPDALLTIMKQLGVAAGDTVYIGDSDVDVMTADNAGVDMIAVTWGFRSEEMLRAAGAYRFATDPEELISLIV